MYVRSSSYCPKDALYSSPCDDATSSPVNSKTSGSGVQLILIPDDDERFVESSVSVAEGISTTETRRYPRREHQPPIRYDDYVRV